MIPPWIRWTLLVLLPVLGFLLACTVGWNVMDVFRLSTLGLILSMLAWGVLGAVGLLAAGLTLAPILPAQAARLDGGEGLDQVPTAPHPRRPARLLLAHLAGLAVGVPVGGAAVAVSRDRYSYYGSDSWDWAPFTLPSLLTVLSVAGVVLLLVLQRRSGAVREPGPVLLHQAALRAVLRALVSGLVAAPLLVLASWMLARRSLGAEGMGVLALGTLLVVGAVAGLLTATEAALPRLRPRARAPVAAAIGGLAPLLAIGVVIYVVELLFNGRTPIDAGQRVFSEIWRELVRQPGRSFGWVPACALPFTLLCLARSGDLPYFGRRAPWPLLGLLPLGLVCGGLAVALFHLLVERVAGSEAGLVVGGAQSGFLGLILGLRLSEPLERRIVTRWVLLTGGRD